MSKDFVVRFYENKRDVVTSYTVNDRAAKNSKAEQSANIMDYSIVSEKILYSNTIYTFLCVKNKSFRGPFKIVSHGGTRACDYFTVELFEFNGVKAYADIKADNLFTVIKEKMLIGDEIVCDLTFKSFGGSVYLVKV